MQNVFNINGLVFWTEEEIRLRETMRDFFAARVQADLLAMNDRWKIFPKRLNRGSKTPV